MTTSERESLFEQDVKAYLEVLPGLLESDSGKFALVGRGGLVKVYESQEEAMGAGYKRFGPGGFLVQEISRVDLENAQHWLESCPS